MAKITRIKASDHSSEEKEAKPAKVTKTVKAKKTTAKTVANLDKKSAKLAKKAAKRKAKAEKKANKKPMPKWLAVITWPFRMIAKPFVALGHYIRDSWREIRQVRWPSRSATWKMVLAVFVYAGFFIVLIMLLDALFTWLFNLLLG